MTSMEITINGETQRMEGPCTLGDLLISLGIPGRSVAVEQNLSIVRREDYETTLIRDGDVIEIIRFVGGG